MYIGSFYRNHPNLTSIVAAGVVGGAMYAISNKLGEYYPFFQTVSPVIGAQLAKIPIHMMTKNRALRFVLPPFLDGISMYGFGSETIQLLGIQNTHYYVGPLQFDSQAFRGGLATFVASTFKKSIEGFGVRGLLSRLVRKG